MPTVPILNPANITQPNQLAAPAAGLDAVTGVASRNAAAQEAFGQKLQGVGDEVTRIAADRTAQANEAAISNLDGDLTGRITARLHDPNTGYLNSVGADAMAGRQGALEGLDDDIKQIGGNLASPRQAVMFQELAQRRRQAAIEAIETHASQQTKVYQNQGLVKRADNARDAAILSYDPANPNSAQHAINVATYMASMDDLAELNGLKGDQRDTFLKDSRATMLNGLITHLISGEKLDAATALFDKYKDSLPVANIDTLSHALKTGNDKTQALSLALSLSGQHPDLAAQEKALDKQFQDKTITADVHALALGQLRAREADQRNAETEQDKSVLGNVWDFVRQNPNATLADLPTSTLSYLTRRDLGTHAQAMFENRGGMVDDAQLYSDLLNSAGNNPAEFANTDLVKLRGNLSSSHFDRLVTVQAGISKQDAAQSQISKVLAQAMTDARADLLTAGIAPSNVKPGTTAAKDLATFQANLADALYVVQDANLKAGKGPLTRDQAKKIAQEQLRDRVIHGTGIHLPFVGDVLQTHNRPGLMSAEEKAATWEFSTQERAQAEEALRSAHYPVTEESIQTYLKRKSGATP